MMGTDVILCGCLCSCVEFVPREGESCRFCASGRHAWPRERRAPWWRRVVRRFGLAAGLLLVLVACAKPAPPYLCASAVTTEGVPIVYCEPMPQKTTP